ncbi:TetM/TetW/TetO/TetS family tetracycline resistance ribosomal protection protein [soil metagenome]
MSTLNCGIRAHVDAGKTSLTERLLHAAGVIDEVGSVDRGSTHTDSLDLERQRGITIKAAVVSFALGDLTVNLIDTPGHSDFIAEVERALSVLDGAVLVVSAVEGVQGQTRVLMRVLHRLGIPTLVFVNKIDRAGARDDGVLRELAERLTPHVVPLGSTRDLGTRRATYAPFATDDPDLRDTTAEMSRAGLVHPVLFGSAITGAGVDELLEGLRTLLPTAAGDPEGPLSGRVFKVERGPAGEKVALARIRSGTVRVRDRVRLPGGQDAKVTAMELFDDGRCVPRDAVPAGRIARLWGLGPVRIGDALGEGAPEQDEHWFAPPTLETVVDPVDPDQRGTLHTALTELAEQDPLIDLRQDDVRRELWVSLYGEVQKEVVAATLASEHGVPVTFRETTTICVERVVGTGEAVELIGVEPNPFLATVGLRVSPAPAGAGVSVDLGVELGSMPASFFTAVEESVRATLGQGLAGWEVPDCAVTITHSGYWARQSHAHGTFDASMSSTAGDFRHLTPLVLTAALVRAGTAVLEPLHRFELEVPDERVGPTLAALARLGGVPHDTEQRGSTYVLGGVLPAAHVHRLQLELPTLSRGLGELTTEFAGYQDVRGMPPTRSRTDHNPLDRREYLLHVQRRV